MEPKNIVIPEQQPIKNVSIDEENMDSDETPKKSLDAKRVKFQIMARTQSSIEISKPTIKDNIKNMLTK